MIDGGCPFCTPDSNRIFFESELVLGIWDAFPVSDRHALLVTRRHVASWFDATPEERRALTDAIDAARASILDRHRPDGFNIGVNVGAMGVLTLASILGLVISKRLGLRAKLLAAGDSNPMRAHGGPVNEGQTVRLGEVGALLSTVALSTLVIEAVLAVLLYPALIASGVDPLTAIQRSSRVR